MKFARHVVAASVVALLAGTAQGLPFDTPPEPPEPGMTPSTVFDNLPRGVAIPGDLIGPNLASNANWFTEWITDLITGGGRDMGDWLCTECSVNPVDEAAILKWGEFVTSVVNPQLWPNLMAPNGTHPGQWKPGDTVAICNGGGVCVILEYHFYNGSLSWFPNPTKKMVKLDRRQYKNKDRTNSNLDNTRVPGLLSPTVLYVPEGTLIVYTDQLRSRVDVGELTQAPAPAPAPAPSPAPAPPPGGGGGGGGGACVHVDSRLPDGRRAGDIKVGDVIQLGDESTEALETRVGVVTYSKSTMARGFRIVTQSGIALLCSDTAPIWTDEGFVRAPDLLGKRVATRVDNKDIVTRFETVEVLSEVGMIEVQHITVGDRAFWAGAEHGAYILHHNKYVPDEE